MSDDHEVHWLIGQIEALTQERDMAQRQAAEMTALYRSLQRYSQAWNEQRAAVQAALAASEQQVAAMTEAGESMLRLLTDHSYGVLLSDSAIRSVLGDWLAAQATGYADPDERAAAPEEPAP